jgi:AbrB family looped-hinge helix DNA binding protein
MNCEDSFYGSATVGERGQIVIPAEARAELGFQAGDKVLIMKHPVYDGLMVFKIDAARSFLDEFTEALNKMDHHTREEAS